ncbi:biopolymer transporter ExbD [Sphingobacterium sp. KU25419]|jgi:biopolymer transport protein ExbD|uniref:ExbD/TolR family protein n=1 Tax=Sphingobacterium faecium TaxID=34087 RepID=UPI0012915EF2|nr:biopolymer transporter ExbD [Sphingobacterium faecium]MQP28370.1 biopolymer transporter ExbD [Sphingobacterium faecium]UZJ66155.1 biopolymer transporter ExbD [Sphingobacterium sp. KU25419]
MNLRSRKNKPAAEVHTSALNDIMFFLMLFFLLASAVSNPQVVKLLLPKSSAGEQSVSKKTLTVSITSDLAYHVEKAVVPYEALEAAIQSQMKTGEELTIMMYVDNSVPIQNVISVMDIANRLKIKVVLATEPKKD